MEFHFTLKYCKCSQDLCNQSAILLATGVHDFYRNSQGNVVIVGSNIKWFRFDINKVDK